MQEEIHRRLENIEGEEQVKILYACESGSRAWGFPSADSDYDVRFLYLHPRDYYLSIDLEKKRDVIERPLEDVLDLSGWDLRKGLRLLRSSNPTLIEWLGSPTIYREHFSIIAKMRSLLSRYYSPLASQYHYLHMAQANFHDYMKGPTVGIKKSFYVLRPLLAIRWIEHDLGVVPMAFQTLVDQVVDSPELVDEIGKLIEAKRQVNELDRGPRGAIISEFITSEIKRLEDKKIEPHFDKPAGPVEAFDAVFRSALDEVWEHP